MGRNAAPQHIYRIGTGMCIRYIYILYIISVEYVTTRQTRWHPPSVSYYYLPWSRDTALSFFPVIPSARGGGEIFTGWFGDSFRTPQTPNQTILPHQTKPYCHTKPWKGQRVPCAILHTLPVPTVSTVPSVVQWLLVMFEWYPPTLFFMNESLDVKKTGPVTPQEVPFSMNKTLPQPIPTILSPSRHGSSKNVSFSTEMFSKLQGCRHSSPFLGWKPAGW